MLNHSHLSGTFSIENNKFWIEVEKPFLPLNNQSKTIKIEVFLNDYIKEKTNIEKLNNSSVIMLGYLSAEKTSCDMNVLAIKKL